MTLKLFLHPFSSYCQKAVTAFYEKEIEFEPLMLDGSQPVAGQFARLWPIGRFPVLLDGERRIFEATSIIEYLGARSPETVPLIPSDPLGAVEVRMWDRFFDNYINYPQQRLVYAAIGREPDKGDGGAQWKAALETAFAVLESHLEGREWATGAGFSLADCAAAPALLYADWTSPIPPRFENVHAYRQRLIARPSYARALNDARPYRHLFPFGAPEGRD